jgi:hypothetical protein
MSVQQKRFVRVSLVLFPLVGIIAGVLLHRVLAKPPVPVKMEFSHIGLITNEKKPGMRYVPATKVWVNDFQNHPYHVEWLYFEADTPVTGPVREKPHVAYMVDSIKEASKGLKELLAPFDGGIATVAFYETKDGAVVEFMEMKEEESGKVAE